jgi:hypothetical protein
MNTSKTVRLAVLYLVASSIVGMSACGSSSTAPAVDASAAVVGAYTLKTVDGSNLPAPLKDMGVVAGTFTSGTVTLSSNGTYTSSLNYTLTNGTPGTSPSTGTYSVSGNTVTFVAAGSPNTVATFSGGNTLTVALNAQAMVFVR